MKKALVFLILTITLLLCLTACHTHLFDGWLTQSATCTENGYKIRYCSCGEYEWEVLPAVGHNYVDGECTNCGDVKEASECKHNNFAILAAKESSCIETGLTEGKKCSDCGEILIAQQEMPITPHLAEIIPAVDATCTETGLAEGKKCSVCGITLVAQQEIAKIAHTYDDKYDESCNKCGFVRDAECAHTETEVIQGNPASCTATGLTEGKQCADCGAIIIQQQIIDVIPHSYDDDYDSSCNICGFTRNINCKHDVPSKIEIIPAVEATCISTGLTQGMKCMLCGTMVVPQAIAPITECTNLRELPYKAPTCIETGLTEGKQCNICGTIVVEQEIVPLTFCISFNNLPYKAPTCMETGLTEGMQCNVCGRIVIAQEIIPVTNCTDLKQLPYKAPTCYEAGLTGGVQCNICGTILVPQEIISVVACVESEWIVDIASTKTEDGFKHTECIMCGRKMREVVISAGSVGLFYSINSDQISCRITDIGICEDIDIVIPKYIDGYRVTTIGNSAFCGQTMIESIIIPEGVETIEDFAFAWCTSLRTIIIHESVLRIGERSFEECTALTNVSIPYSVTSIGYNAFIGCSSLKYNQYGNALYLGNDDNMFVALMQIQNKNVENCEIHKDTRFINSSAFAECTLMNDIKVDENNKYFKSIDGNLYSKDGKKFIRYAVGKKNTSFTMPDSVTSIGDRAFINATLLRNINIPDSVESIGYCVFVGCIYLQYNQYDNALYLGNDNNPYLILIRAKSESIQSCIISNTTKFIYNTTYWPNDGYSNGAFVDCMLKDIIIPDSVISIGDAAFSMCKSLTNVTIGNSVINIGDSAFADCRSLTNIVIPDSVTSIGNHAFFYCSSLTNIVIPDSVTSIGDAVFGDCTSLSSVEIGDAVTSIGDWAFQYCAALRKITIPENVLSIGSYAFYGCRSLYIYCEAESKPIEWSVAWNENNRPVVWGYKGE